MPNPELTEDELMEKIDLEISIVPPDEEMHQEESSWKFWWLGKMGGVRGCGISI